MSTPKFTDAKFLSAKEKETIFRVWCRFLKNRFKRTCFTRALYQHLHLHCGFIAHYSIHGFYGTYFTTPADIKSFIRAFINQVEGIPYLEEYSDINSAMLKELHAISGELMTELDQQELEMLERRKKGIEARIATLRHEIEG